MGEARFTPYLDALARETQEALARLGGWAPEAMRAFTLEQPEPGRWLAIITLALPDGALTLEVFDRALGRRSWFQTARLGWGYHAGAQGDPFQRGGASGWLRALRERVSARDRVALRSPEVDEVFAAVARYLPLTPGRDEDFRLLMRSPERSVGALWLGARCDRDCDICWQRRDAPEPPPALFATWLDELLAAGARSIILSGGEPTLREDLVPLVRRAKSAGAHVVLETHAGGLADDALRRALVAAGVDEVVASLHSADAGVSDAMTRTPGGHARTLDGIAACLRDGVTVGVHCVVDVRNAEGLAEHAALILGRLRGVRRVSYSTPTRYADRGRYLASMAPMDLVRPPLVAALRALRAGGVEARALGMSGFPLCVTEDPAPQRDMTDDERGGRVFPAGCEGCAARARCAGVPEDYVTVWGARGLRARGSLAGE